jgi:hypothetical protein
MRIAFAGSHRVGKSSLIERVAERLSRHTIVDEPYNLLEEEGYEHADPPSLEDFEAQLERSLVELEGEEPDVLFDRCPADVLAYLLTHEDAHSFEADDWLARTREAMQSLDLVVFVPIERPDRIPLASHEQGAYRRKVDQRVHDLLVDDALGLGAEVLTVRGDLRARVEQVIASIRAD